MMHFPPCFRFQSYFRTFTFSRKFFRFSSDKISDDLFFSHRPQISNFPPILPLSVHFPPVWRKLFPPYFEKFTPCFQEIHLLFTYFSCISFPPYFDHDAFMHHPMHVLDAPGKGMVIIVSGLTDCRPNSNI